MSEPEVYAMLALVLMELQKINEILNRVLISDEVKE